MWPGQYALSEWVHYEISKIWMNSDSDRKDIHWVCPWLPQGLNANQDLGKCRVEKRQEAKTGSEISCDGLSRFSAGICLELGCDLHGPQCAVFGMERDIKRMQHAPRHWEHHRERGLSGESQYPHKSVFSVTGKDWATAEVWVYLDTHGTASTGKPPQAKSSDHFWWDTNVHQHVTTVFSRLSNELIYILHVVTVFCFIYLFLFFFQMGLKV